MYFVPVACRLSPWSDPGTRRGSGPTATHVGTYLPRYSLLLRCRARDKEPFSFPAVSFLGFNSTTTRCKADAQHLAWASACQVACPVCALIVRIPTYVGATSGGRVPSPSPQCSLCSDCMLVVHTSYIHTTHTYIPTTYNQALGVAHTKGLLAHGASTNALASQSCSPRLWQAPAGAASHVHATWLVHVARTCPPNQPFTHVHGTDRYIPR